MGDIDSNNDTGEDGLDQSDLVPKFVVDGPCFVATAVYQNPDARQVELYRGFRENYLRPNRVGKRFVDWYEGGGGQRLTDIVERHPTLRVPSKAALDVGAYAIKALKYVKERAA